MDKKQECARQALRYVPAEGIIGLGGGTTIAHLCRYIKEAGKKVHIVTPSMDTLALCQRLGLSLLPLSLCEHVDIAFDGCDEVDMQLNALKSGGGIHLREKLIAHMADEYMLLAEESKVSSMLSFRHPIVIEVLEDAYAYVIARLKTLGAEVIEKSCSGKIGAMRSDHGNLLIDVHFAQIKDVRALNRQLEAIRGVLATSLFTEEVSKVLVIKEDGHSLLERNV